MKCFHFLSAVDYCHILLKFGHWLIRGVREWRGTKDKNKNKKWHRAFNRLKPMCNSMAWNLEAASHDEFPLHNGLQLL